MTKVAAWEVKCITYNAAVVATVYVYLYRFCYAWKICIRLVRVIFGVIYVYS